MGNDIRDVISDKVNSLLQGNSHVKLLEAGCGSSSHVRINDVVYAVGIDISKEQLEANTVVQERILGDIQEYPLPKEEFDVAVCWMVLEHVPRPEDAILNMFGSLKPQGLLILGIPNLYSIKGIVTKMTPFWFHESFYKLMKYQSRHFPTYLRTSILPKRLMRFAGDQGFSVEFCKLEEGTVAKRFRNRFWIADAAFSAVDSLTQFVTFGKTQSILLDNCFLILRKRG
jgi:2-polyprenyl-3-methyl-5-hydroxy-6-metoxy-1,4-benzoquinol methylase